MAIYEQNGIDSDIKFEIHIENEQAKGLEYINLEIDHISDSFVKKYRKYTDLQIERKSRSSSIEETPFSSLVINFRQGIVVSG
jgi:hypothetical protein